MHDFFQTPSKYPGLRLHKLQMMNWGTFDSSKGRVFTIRPEGKTTLAVGENGAGKSTLTDALVSLLVGPQIRSYNVAAASGGTARKRDRNLRTYLRGAYDHGNDGDRTAIQFLRPGAGIYGVLLAYFGNDDFPDAGFTLAQILYLNPDEKVDTVYAFSKGEKSIEKNLGQIESFARLRQQVEERGFQATTTFKQYEKWFTKAAGFRSKAMEVFNQTVAVKDIVSLNDFIRRHMLEKRNWREEIDRILTHFNQLAEAHRLLVRTREQLDLLKPIVQAAGRYEKASSELQRLRDLKAALPAWFCATAVDGLIPLIKDNEQRLEAEKLRKGEIEQHLQSLGDRIGQLKHAIDQTGGPRLQALPGLIKAARQKAASKRATWEEFRRSSVSAGIDSVLPSSGIEDDEQFLSIRESLTKQSTKLEKTIPELDRRKTGLGYQRHQLDGEMKELEMEIQSLRDRKTALPARFVRMRQGICAALHLPEKDLPFAAELMSVKMDEREWESSIEMVLRGFALSLLVPDRYYRQVSQFVDKTKLTDASGTGQRLVYLRIGGLDLTANQDLKSQRDSGAFRSDRLPGKLDFRPQHPLVPWLRGELDRQFDLRCCETVEEFQNENGDAMTTSRHVKRGRGKRHEKDDRDHLTNRSRYVLGWDNREKLRHLIEEATEKSRQRNQLDTEITQIDSSLQKLHAQQTAAQRALETSAFHQVDFRAEERQVAELQREEEELRTGDETMRDLDEQRKEAELEQKTYTKHRDECIVSIHTLEDDLKTARRLLEKTREMIESWKSAGTWDEHKSRFEKLEPFVANVDRNHPLALEAILTRKENSFSAQIDSAREKLKPLEDRLCGRIEKFLRKFSEHSDLHARVEYAADFSAMHDQIVREDLPGYESQFKERLNDKAGKEIAVLRANLQKEEREIKSNINLLNNALREIEYDTGRHMQLEAASVSDPEILKFQRQLRECLADSFDASLEAQEARFKRVETLIADLRDDTRFRDRVTDVRRWFNFFACVIDNGSGEEVSRYSDGSGRSGGEKSKLAFTILVAAIAYQYHIDPRDPVSERFHFVVVDEMFAKMADKFSLYALELFERLGLQLLIIAPLDAKARITDDYVDYYALITKDEQTHHSDLVTLTAERFRKLHLAPTPGSK